MTGGVYDANISLASMSKDTVDLLLTALIEEEENSAYKCWSKLKEFTEKADEYIKQIRIQKTTKGEPLSEEA